MIEHRRRFARKSERGTAVVVVVMVTTLITAIGVFAVRNVSQIDQAVGYSRQSAQTMALAELGTSAAMAQITTNHTHYTGKMSDGMKCEANGVAPPADATCFKLDREALEVTTVGNNGETLLEPAVPGSESGSFGPIANTTGVVNIELTDKYDTNKPLPGESGTPVDITLTTTAVVTPITSSADPCGNNVPTMAVKKVMRAHVIVPPT